MLELTIALRVRKYVRISLAHTNVFAYPGMNGTLNAVTVQVWVLCGEVSGTTSHSADINECKSPNACVGEGVTCQNLPGSFSCVCHDAMKEYTLDQGCQLVDICQVNNGALNPCDKVNGQCVSTLDGASCFCKTGFRLADDGYTCEGTKW